MLGRPGNPPAAGGGSCVCRSPGADGAVLAPAGLPGRDVPSAADVCCSSRTGIAGSFSSLDPVRGKGSGSAPYRSTPGERTSPQTERCGLVVDDDPRFMIWICIYRCVESREGCGGGERHHPRKSRRVGTGAGFISTVLNARRQSPPIHSPGMVHPVCCGQTKERRWRRSPLS